MVIPETCRVTVMQNALDSVGHLGLTGAAHCVKFNVIHKEIRLNQRSRLTPRFYKFQVSRVLHCEHELREMSGSSR